MNIKELMLSIPEKVSASLLRFPATVTFSAAGSLLLILWKMGDGNEGGRIYPGIIMSAFLGMLLFTLVQLVSERFSMTGNKRIAAYAVGAFFIGLYYILLPRHLQDCDGTHYAIITLSVFIALFIAPFAGRGISVSRAFQAHLWRMVTWFIYAVTAAGIIYAGIALAYLMISLLFDLRKDDILAYVFFVCGGFIAPLIFLHGFPHRDSMDTAENPKGFLRVLVNYVFIPLVMIYLTILAVYFGKTLFTHELPKGTTAYLVLSCSMLGIFIYYLVHGEEGDDRPPMASLFTRLFFWCMIPMTLLLWIAIILRLSEYGITERRYIVMMSALWLTAVTGHGLFIRRKNLVTWPMIYALMLIASSFGPWGMFSVSRRSQFNRIMEIGSDYGIISDGKFVRTNDMLPQKASQNLHSSIRYLLENHGGERIIGLIPEDIRKDNKELAMYDGDDEWRSKVAEIIAAEFNLNISDMSVLETYHEKMYTFTREFNAREPVNLEGMSYLVPLDYSGNHAIRAGGFAIMVDGDKMKVTVSAKNCLDLVIELNRYAKFLAGKYKNSGEYFLLPEPGLTFREDNGTINGKIIIKSINISESESGEVRVNTFSADLLVGLVK